jgi:hypothetical protein
MPSILLATHSGIRTFTESGNETSELAGHKVGPLEPEPGGACLAIVDEKEVWRRAAEGTWSALAAVDIGLESIVSCRGVIFCGAMNEAALVRIPPHDIPERLKSFDNVPGRAEWFAGGPPLSVRSLATTSDEQALLAAVHVGGIPSSDDAGDTWTPTIPVMFDVHEVRAHPHLPNLVAAAAAVGLCISRDKGRTWTVVADGLPLTYSLAVAVLDNEILFSIQDGPFAKRSQVWRYRLAAEELEQVRDGLPESLEGKVDTNQIAAGRGRVAIADCSGNRWLSDSGSSGWQRIATALPYAFGLAIVPGRRES